MRLLSSPAAGGDPARHDSVGVADPEAAQSESGVRVDAQEAAERPVPLMMLTAAGLALVAAFPASPAAAAAPPRASAVSSRPPATAGSAPQAGGGNRLGGLNEPDVRVVPPRRLARDPILARPPSFIPAYKNEEKEERRRGRHIKDP